MAGELFGQICQQGLRARHAGDLLQNHFDGDPGGDGIAHAAVGLGAGGVAAGIQHDRPVGAGPAADFLVRKQLVEKVGQLDRRDLGADMKLPHYFLGLID
ncbi:MAG: hypothetical protein ABWY05_16760 [Noviherbaspirillum sp.]